MQKRALYERYHSHRKLQKRIINNKNFTYRHIVGLLDKQRKVKKVLDVGCSVGTLDYYLASKGKKVLGIDYSKKAIETAEINRQTLDISKKLTFKVKDFPRQRVSGKYDMVLCISVLEHIKNDKKTVSAISKLLRKKGVGVFSVPSKSSVLYRLGLVKKHDKRVGHLRRYTAEELSDLLKDSGFRVTITKKEEGFIREFLFTTALGSNIIRVANRFSFVSDTITFFDNLLKIFGEAQINMVAKKI